MSAEERRHTTKMRANGAQVVELVGGLAQRHEVSLPRISVEDMKDDLTLAQRLAPLEHAIARLSQTIRDKVADVDDHIFPHGYQGFCGRVPSPVA